MLCRSHCQFCVSTERPAPNVDSAAPDDCASPKKRADRTPGAPSRASTTRPESSASAGSPVQRLACRAFSSAFSKKVPNGSSQGATPKADCATRSTPRSVRRRRISTSFPALPLANTQRGALRSWAHGLVATPICCPALARTSPQTGPQGGPAPASRLSAARVDERYPGPRGQSLR